MLTSGCLNLPRLFDVQTLRTFTFDGRSPWTL